MRRRQVLSGLTAVFCATLACSEEDANPWVQLIGRSWSVPASSEFYFCTGVQVSTAWHITGFRTVIPAGQRRVIVTASSTPRTTGDFACDITTPYTDTRMLYAAGVGTDEIVFPAGIGVRVPAGQFVTLFIQIHNNAAAPLAGTTTIEVRQSTPADVMNEADMTFVGQLSFSVPGNTTGYDVLGGCVLTAASTAFALLPVMRQLGTYLKVDRQPGGGAADTLHSAPFNLSDQPFHMLTPPVALSPNDLLEVICTYVNPNMQPVPSGDSMNEEACLAGMYRYPVTAQPGPLGCTSAAAAAQAPRPVTTPLSAPRRPSSSSAS